LAGAGRTDHEQIVSAGRGDFERALGALLSLDVGEVECGTFGFQDFGLRPGEDLRNDLDVRTGPGRFRSARRRAHQALAARVGADGGRQDAGDRCDRTVEAEFAQHGKARQGIVRNGADRGHQPERYRQVVVTAFLGQGGRREIDGDAARRQRQARSDQRRAHAFARFRNRVCERTYRAGLADNGWIARELSATIGGVKNI